MFRSLILISFLTSSIFIQGSFAQINVKIGYSMAFVNPETNNNLIQAFNSKQSTLIDLEKPMGELKFMHGINLGLSYKISNYAIHMGWENLSRDRIAVGENNDGSLFQEKLFYSANNLFAGLETIHSFLGYGATIGLSRIKIKETIATSDFKKTLVTENQLYSKVYLIFLFGGQNNVAFGLQPYIQFPLGDVDLTGMRQELGLEDNLPVKEEFPMFGLSFIFYNGRQ